MSGDRGGRRGSQDAAAFPDVELVHVASADDQLERLPPRRPIPRPWWAALAVTAAVLVAVLVAVLAYHSHDRNSATPPAPSHSSGPTPDPSRPRPLLTEHRRVVPASRATVADAPVKAVTVTGLGGAVVPAAAGTELFARGRSALLRVELATGRITQTRVPPLPSNVFGFNSFLVGPDRVIVYPPDSGPGYLVRDGRPAQTLNIPAFTGPALPGPDARHVWVSTVLAGDRMRLVDLDGRASGPVLQAPPGGSRSDGSGYVAYGDTSGVYDVRPTGVHRITTGELLAVGPTGWLVAECDMRHRCDTVSIDRISGQRRRIGARCRQADDDGVICADGSTAALFENNSAAGSRLTLLDLRSGHARTVHVALPQDHNSARLVWTPDSRYLFTVAANGRIAVVDKTGHVRLLPATLPPITQLALRTPAR